MPVGRGRTRSLSGSVEGHSGLVLPGVQAAQMPYAPRAVWQPALGLAASCGRDAVRVPAACQEVALLVASAHEQLLILQAGTRARLPAADCEFLAGVIVAEVQATEPAAFATSHGRHSVGVFALGQQAALLVADTQEQLLVHQADARRVRARAIACDVVTGAGHVTAEGTPLVHGARAALAASPRAGADRIPTVGEEAAPPVAQAGEELFVITAHLVVVHAFRRS
mmetsp:Transcript_123857/g.344718  ORF Transcript_123857/g.344718 Transcript_123857/m.344718 type:complete len:225 (+) Transcript_123857:224-898(+)